jgi:hypothetical protein
LYKCDYCEKDMKYRIEEVNTGITINICGSHKIENTKLAAMELMATFAYVVTKHFLTRRYL